MSKSNEFFLREKPIKLFFIVALPGLVSVLAMSAYSIIEGVFIGRLIGEAAFAAVNLAMPFVMINFSLADLVGVGSSVLIFISLGRQDRDRANNFFTCSILLIILAAVLVGVLLFFTSPVLARLIGAEGELAALAVKYVRVFAIIGPVTTLVFAMDNYLRISGFVRGSMLLNIFMSLLVTVFLFLFLGVMDMNVEGSALASGVAMGACALIAFILFVMKKSVLRFTRPRLTFAMLREIVACGLPVFHNNIAGRVASIVMNTALLEMSAHAMQIFCTAYIFRWFGFAVQGFYSSIEKPLPASILSVCSAMVFPIIFVIALSALSLDGLWLNMKQLHLLWR